jgi:hypothetical protein
MPTDRSAAAKKAAVTRKRRAAGRKAAQTKRRRAAAATRQAAGSRFSFGEHADRMTITIGQWGREVVVRSRRVGSKFTLSKDGYTATVVFPDDENRGKKFPR